MSTQEIPSTENHVNSKILSLWKEHVQQRSLFFQDVVQQNFPANIDKLSSVINAEFQEIYEREKKWQEFQRNRYIRLVTLLQKHGILRNKSQEIDHLPKCENLQITELSAKEELDVEIVNQPQNDSQAINFHL